MQDLIFQVAVGSRCQLYETCIDSVAAYASSHNLAHEVLREPVLRVKPDVATSGRSESAIAKLGYLPIMEKLVAFDRLSSFRHVAIIDSDVWVRPGAPNIFDELKGADFSGVRERDVPRGPKHEKKLRNYSRIMFRQLSDVCWDWQDGIANFYNMGVMVLGERFQRCLEGMSAAEFVKRPELKRFVDGEGAFKWSTDQILHNWWIRHKRLRRRNLSWKWNCLYGVAPQEALHEAEFVHFFLRDLLPKKGENIKDILPTL